MGVWTELKEIIDMEEIKSIKIDIERDINYEDEEARELNVLVKVEEEFFSEKVKERIMGKLDEKDKKIISIYVLKEGETFHDHFFGNLPPKQKAALQKLSDMYMEDEHE